MGRSQGSEQNAMEPSGYATPEAAALASFGRYARVHASEQNGSYAVVLLATNELPTLYPYQIVCSREPEGWVEGANGNGAGWTHLENGLGVRTFWGEAPARAESVRVHVAGTIYDAPVRQGYFFLTVWLVPAEFA